LRFSSFTLDFDPSSVISRSPLFSSSVHASPGLTTLEFYLFLWLDYTFFFFLFLQVLPSAMPAALAGRVLLPGYLVTPSFFPKVAFLTPPPQPLAPPPLFSEREDRRAFKLDSCRPPPRLPSVVPYVFSFVLRCPATFSIFVTRVLI